MPLYEYHCKSCGQVFEKMARWSEAGHNPTCPHCQSQETSKKISTFASPGSSASATPVSSSGCGSSGRFG